MSTRTHRILRTILIVVGSLLLLIVIGGRIATHYLHGYLETAFAKQHGHFSTVEVSLLRRSIALDSIAWILPAKPNADSTYKLTVQHLTIDGIDIWALWRQHKVRLGNIVIRDAALTSAAVPAHRDTVRTQDGAVKISSVEAGSITIENLHANVPLDSSTRLTADITLTTRKLAVALDQSFSIQQAISMALDAQRAEITDVKLATQLYHFTIAGIYLDSKKKKLHIDSTRITPLYSKYQFTRKVGKQVDRFTALLPNVAIHHARYTNDSLLSVARIDIVAPSLHAYRDKRMPFIKTHTTPLPMAMINRFSVGFAVDSIAITDGNITYEEFPEEGFHPGRITLTDLDATLAHITNRSYFAGRDHATVRASTMVMGKGKMRCTFTMPYDEDNMYHAEGSMTAFPLYHVNAALENLAFITIESGQLNSMMFSFDYNDKSSQGELLLDYQDLRIISLTKARQSGINKVKTWLLNTILKNDKDRTVSEKRRTGVIAFERDRKRAIFNFWWKSLLSGLKSSVLEATFQKEQKKKKR